MSKKRIYLDYTILIPYLILSSLGVLMVYSASSYSLMIEGKNEAKQAIMQGLFFVFSLIAIFLIYKMKTSVFQNKKFIQIAMFVIGIMLVLTRFTPLGVEVNGAKGWLKIGPGQIQPAEFLKIMLVWYLAYILARRQDKIEDNFKEAAQSPIFIVSLLIFMVLIQPDTGGAMILLAIASVMFFASGISYIYSMLIAGGGFIVGVGLLELIILTKGKMFPGRLKYIYDRFAIYKNPFIDPFDKGHQMVNSYYAIYNGGWFGVGLGKSVQKKGFLPEAQTDFMFSIVLEELGLIIGILILLLLLFLIIRIIWVGIKAKKPFNSMMCIGIGGMLFIQTFVNVGGITGFIPLTGVTFPFLSQGGSSLLTLSIGIGFVLNICADEKRHLELGSVESNKDEIGDVVQLPRS